MTPDSEHWDKLQDLFHLAETAPDRDLDELLLEATDDADLRARAKVLIVAGRRAETNAGLDGAPPLADKIGPYTVRKHLGTGGIGAVYLVERTVAGVAQRSALKVLARHAVGPFFTERFAREQHILASLQHEHITRMIDAGVTEEGQAYLVMEYVDGTHLDHYCDERSLGVPARLGLFLQVCQAISYAHQNLVVHLDLKPSNILVTNDGGAVKVLDFGTSKLIQPDSLLTTTVMATPAYASPEQLLNEPVTTVCDVYALGAILFELLSGRRPNQDSTVASLIERSMKEFPPEPITENLTEAAATHRGMTQTRLRSLLQGDLATIVSKCLTPRPKDRYATVDALIDDVHRYLEGRPIQARPQTTTYRLSKFVRRNRVSVLAGTIAAIALAASLGYAAWRQHQAVREARRALQMQTFMVELFSLANSDHTGKPVATVPELLRIGVQVAPSLIQDAGDRRAALLSLSQSMASNNDYDDAERNLMVLIDNAKAAGDLLIEAQAESALSDVENTQGNMKQALALSAHALSLSHSSALSTSNRVEIQGEYASIREDSGDRTAENLKLLQDDVVVARKEHLLEPQLAMEIFRLAMALNTRQRIPESDALFHEALGIYQKMPYAACDEGAVYRWLGHNRTAVQDYQGAGPLFQKSYDIFRSCAGEDSLRTLAVQAYLANSMAKSGKEDEAVAITEASLPHMRKAVGPQSLSLAGPLIVLTRIYNARGQYDKAEPLLEELNKVIHGKLSGRQTVIVGAEDSWATALAGQHRYAEALIQARIAVEAEPEHPTPGDLVVIQRANATLHKIELDGATNSSLTRK